MKLRNQVILALALTFALVACSESEKKDEKSDEKTEETCTFSYDGTTTKVTWTAFKTTDKVGVGGTFDEVEITGTEDANSAIDVVKKAQFKIPVNTVNSAKEERDEKIKEFFFKTLTNTAFLTGAVTSVDNQGENGSADVDITMNEQTKTVKMDYSQAGDTLKMNATIDVLEWNGDEALKALNKKCYDLHKGDDGVSKLWSEVEIGISTVLKKKCE